MLTENGKNWIAQHFGKKIDDKYCYDYNISYYWYNPDTGNEELKTNGTGGMVNILQMAKDLGKENEIYVKVNDKKFYYSDLKAGNDGQDLTLDDVKWVVEHDGYPAGEDQYCFTPTAPPPEEYGYIHVESDPSGASVYIDGSYVGTTPGTFKVSVGTHEVRITKSGYKTETRTVTVSKNETKTILVTLEKEEVTGKGYLELHTYDADTGNEIHAWIYVDEVFTGKSTPETLELDVGPHDIRLYREGYEEYKTSITISPGTQRKDIYMKKIPIPPIEIEVVPKKISEECVEPILEPPYSDIPTEVMLGVDTTFRIYFANNCDSLDLKVWLRFEHSTTGESYTFGNETYEIAAGGSSVIIHVAFPETASTGVYYLYLGYELAK